MNLQVKLQEGSNPDPLLSVLHQENVQILLKNT